METRLVVPGRLPDLVFRPVIFLMMLLFPELGLPVDTRKRSSISGNNPASMFSIFSMESHEPIRVKDTEQTG